MASKKKYWLSMEELKPGSTIVEKISENEFPEEIPTDEFLGDKESLENSSTSRRDFLKYLGFTTAAAALASCEGPVRKAIPYVVKPEEITPGKANYYATTMFNGFDFAHVIVKTREGRPIHIKPNKKAGSGANARVLASVLNLYDSNRLRNPKSGGKETSWDKVDAQIPAKLKEIIQSGKQVVLLTGTCASPSSHALLQEFNEKFGPVRHVVYDAVSESAALDAFESMYGQRALPEYRFDKSDVIVSIGADFLGDWQGGGYEVSYINGRKPETGKMSYHTQIEANMTLTGANADKRIPLKPSHQVFALVNLYNAVTGNNLPSKSTPADEEIMKLAHKLKSAGSKGVVVTGIQDKNAQLLALAINKHLNSQAMDTQVVRHLRKGSDHAVKTLLQDMKSGKVGALLMYNTNPVFTIPAFSNYLSKVGLVVDFTQLDDETAQLSHYALPAPHYLEAWGDVAPRTGEYAVIQPVIRPLFNTRSLQDSLLKWMGDQRDFYQYIKERFHGDWNKMLMDGLIYTAVMNLEEIQTEELPEINWNQVASQLVNTPISDIEMTLYTKTSMGDGQMANNPWLQELPDPITRATWDNYLTISPADAAKFGITNTTADNGALDGPLVDVTVNGTVLNDVPVYIQPGQAEGSVGLALGYGHTHGVKDEMKVGVNAYPAYRNFNTFQPDVKIGEPKGTHEFALIQLQHTLAGRHDVLKEVSLHDYKHEDPHHWNHKHKFSEEHREVEAEKVNLWAEFDDTTGHKFNLSIDLTACTGCAACVIACHSENNVPVVGKREVRRSRDMHWLRIDRYYSSEVPTFEAAREEGLSRAEMYHGVERVAANPQVAFQPVMCQHCNHAPCETVCPVQATSHGRQGQNHMAYNRCIGTRYCGNNCPYRVRRFNWFRYNMNDEFDYHMNDEYGRMVLNPDVVVRSRGVMEKCSLCIQMTQATILDAKREGRAVRDGEFQTACTNACSTGALVFGDVNDKDSKIKALTQDKRAYHLLDFIGTQPNVVYQVKVRNEEA